MKHFIDIDQFSKLELRKILIKAKQIKKNKNKNLLFFKNISLGLLFEKQSTRTRLSFSIGMQKLGGNVIELDANQIGFGIRESENDILKVMSQYIDILMVRNHNHEKMKNLASKNHIPIINGLSNFSHPCQILSDIFTIEEHLGAIKGKTIVWLGDANNVLISLIQAAELFKFKLNILTPKSLINKINKIFKDQELNYSYFYNNINKGMNEADCVMTDTWFSMGDIVKKKNVSIFKKFKVNKNIMKKAKKNAIFMHCLPANRNQEVTNEVIDGNQSVVWEQAKNRMYVQQSIINYLVKNVKK